MSETAGTVTISVSEYLQLLEAKKNLEKMADDDNVLIMNTDHFMFGYSNLTILTKDDALKQLTQRHNNIVEKLNHRLQDLEQKSVPILNLTRFTVKDLK